MSDLLCICFYGFSTIVWGEKNSLDLEGQYQNDSPWHKLDPFLIMMESLQAYCLAYHFLKVKDRVCLWHATCLCHFVALWCHWQYFTYEIFIYLFILSEKRARLQASGQSHNNRLPKAFAFLLKESIMFYLRWRLGQTINLYEKNFSFFPGFWAFYVEC